MRLSCLGVEYFDENTAIPPTVVAVISAEIETAENTVETRVTTSLKACDYPAEFPLAGPLTNN
jgi:hypothetical protein